MFTGIIEEVGNVVAVEELGNGRAFRIRAASVLEALRPGDSVAIDGACHTVTERLPEGFVVQSVASTLARTILGEYRTGRRVNLERAVAMGDRLGGHLVQGHVDGVGTVRRVERSEELVRIDFTAPEEILAVTVLHGSIALNGISLTVNALPDAGTVQVSIIPFTWDHTNVSDLQAGDRVNLEGDTIGKYVRQLLGAPTREAADLRRAWGY